MGDDSARNTLPNRRKDLFLPLLVLNWRLRFNGLSFECSTVSADFAISLASSIFELNNAHLNQIDADFWVDSVVKVSVEAIATSFLNHSVVVDPWIIFDNLPSIPRSIPKALNPIKRLHPMMPTYAQMIKKTEQQIPPDVLLQPSYVRSIKQSIFFLTSSRTSEFFGTGGSVDQHCDSKSDCQWRDRVHTVLKSLSHHWPVISRFVRVQKSPLASYRENPFWFWICSRIPVVGAVFQEQFRRLRRNFNKSK